MNQSVYPVNKNVFLLLCSGIQLYKNIQVKKVERKLASMGPVFMLQIYLVFKTDWSTWYFNW